MSTHKQKYIHLWLVAALLTLMLAACGTTRHVGDDEFLLDHMRIEICDSSGIKPKELTNYVRQKPNSRTLGIAPMRLHTYSLSGKDSTKWYNRWLQNLGEPPVIYSQHLTEVSRRQLSLALINRGYMNAQVTIDTIRPKAKKIDVTYRVIPGTPHRIASITKVYSDPIVGAIIEADTLETFVKPGTTLDRNILDSERARIASKLQSLGYYAFVKDMITFRADTVSGNKNVNLTMNISGDDHRQYMVQRVIFQPSYSPELTAEEAASLDTIAFGDIYIITDPDDQWKYISPKTLADANRITPKSPYNSREINSTYEALGRLGIIRSSSIHLTPTGEYTMDAIVRLTRNPLQGISVELEGTNSEGDLGAGIGFTYQHRNIFHGSELLTIKGRGSYESISGDLEGLINNHYTEGSAEVALTFPKFMAPFLSKSYRRNILASTEFSISGNYQERPEYTRVIAGAGWRYKWNNRRNNNRRIFDLVDINYVFLPRSTINFLEEIGAGNPLLRYSYEDHLIMRMGYSTFLTNKTTTAPIPGVTQQQHDLIWTFRGSAEIAGNLLYGISNAIGQKKSDGAYKIFGTAYSQYAKAEADYMIAKRLSERLTLAFHAGAGIAVPYGNSSMVPFEKRFYSGGANSVRGWGVRTLGPGRYDARNDVNDFIRQCGDIRLDLNVELRMKLFWVLEGAAFIDAGNVWTIRNYETQPGGQFRFKSFYKELGWAYGLGLRLDFTYFVLRFDLGMKAYNPAMNQEPWPLIHPKWSRDATFHFSVGYPF
ncbi:MAG: outer membrane protein assembly factor [Bacteroidales bacterium]|nr:outer membrane protein assembly factor [Bacteroidales bacterium]